MAPIFEGFITFCIVLNTLILGSAHYGMDKEVEDVF
jgi:hypothetical protein